MQSVSILKAAKLWDKYFIQEPLTLEEFIQTSPTLNNYIFPFIKDTIKDLSNNPSSVIYMQTCLGVGKSTLSSILTAYTIYLYCISIEPSKLWGLSPSVKYAFGILGTRKTAQLAINSLISVLEQIPMFKKTESHDDAEGPICYNLDRKNALMEVYYVSMNGSTGVPLSLIPVQSNADIIGVTLIGANFSEIQSFMEATGASSEQILECISKTRARIDSRLGPRDNFVHRLFVEKSPYDIEDDALDDYIHNSAPKCPDTTIIKLKPIWELFPERYNTTDMLYLDLYTEKVLISANENTIAFPSTLKDAALENPKHFIRDMIGLPTSIIENPKRRELKKFYNDLLYAQVKIIMKDGCFYFKDRNSDIEVRIPGLFR